MRYACHASQLGTQMVSTIRDAVVQLGKTEVEERGYILLESDVSYKPSELAQLVQDCTMPEVANGITACVDTDLSVDVSTFQLNLASRTPHDPEMQFQDWVNNPLERTPYLICEPLCNHGINNLLDAGPKLNARPHIPGDNHPYWYISLVADTPATIHIEDANSASANLLLAGAEKHWIVVHRSSAAKFEECIRKEFKKSQTCSEFVRHHNIVVGPSWLAKRGLIFEVVVQRPGDVMCTMPG
ncbi:hypothetical protein T440DRAFT_279078 [Plenodomus tracheiphilus IPT5]|uniref:JmjC domain-containing protein n=1 Tax=Plenodomus tracheiphilus IPT5 TaxID=1408161 RepID=A0A6A7AT31_9PLEO|nr:hypothetical protein T440DRAFT_279078 [Plenodomus tracheiphilus IPT5]